MAVAGVKPTGLCSPCIRVHWGKGPAVPSSFGGLFWLTLGKEVLYELLQRARTAASASILVLALCSSWKIPLSGKNRPLVWSWSEPCWAERRASRDPFSWHKPAGPSSSFLSVMPGRIELHFLRNTTSQAPAGFILPDLTSIPSRPWGSFTR